MWTLCCWRFKVKSSGSCPAARLPLRARAHQVGCGRLHVARALRPGSTPSPQLTPPSRLSCCGFWAGVCLWSVAAPYLSSGPALWGSELPGGEEPGSCFQVGLGGCTGGGAGLRCPQSGSPRRGCQGVRVQWTLGKAQMPLDPPATELTPRVGPRPQDARRLARPCLLGVGGPGAQPLSLQGSPAESQAGGSGSHPSSGRAATPTVRSERATHSLCSGSADGRACPRPGVRRAPLQASMAVLLSCVNGPLSLC